MRPLSQTPWEWWNRTGHVFDGPVFFGMTWKQIKPHLFQCSKIKLQSYSRRNRTGGNDLAVPRRIVSVRGGFEMSLNKSQLETVSKHEFGEFCTTMPYRKSVTKGLRLQ